jgi:hypothetical protein
LLWDQRESIIKQNRYIPESSRASVFRMTQPFPESEDRPSTWIGTMRRFKLKLAPTLVIKNARENAETFKFKAYWGGWQGLEPILVMCLGRTVSTDGNSNVLDCCVEVKLQTGLDRIIIKLTNLTLLDYAIMQPTGTYTYLSVKVCALEGCQAHHRPQNDSSVIL